MIVLVATILVMLAFLFFYFAFPEKNEDVQFDVVELSSKKIKSKLFIKKLVWGMTSDNCIVTIGTSNIKENKPNRNKNYIYNGLDPLFYKVSGDTLSIYTYKTSTVPKDFLTAFKIIQIELENPEMMELIEKDNYKNKGLVKVN